MAVIKVNNLSKYYEFYKKKPGLSGTLESFFRREKLFAKAVDNISFSIERGELVGFLGPNGAGKTTTLKILSGILHPTSGEAKVLGFTPFKRDKAYQQQFSLVMGQKNQLLNDLPALDNFTLLRDIYMVPEKKYRKTLDELVELLDVKEILNVQVRKLSLGQRMKIELIAALLHSPKVLFLDEPTIGLDVLAQKNIRDFIKRYNQEKKTTIILTSHYMEDIRQLCKRVVIINLGKIIYDGNLSELIDKYATYKLLKLTFDRRIPKNKLKEYGLVEDYSNFGCLLKVDRKDSKNMAAKLLASDLPVTDLLIDEVSIDDVIRQIFREF